MIVELMVRRKTSLHARYLEQTVNISKSVTISELQTPDQRLYSLPENYTLIRYWNESSECIG